MEFESYLESCDLAPRHGFEPRFTAPKAAVLPLDDRGTRGKDCSQCSVHRDRLATFGFAVGIVAGGLLELRVEANLGRCWARASNPLCGTLCRGWVRLPLASATPPAHSHSC